jgi:nitroreductase
MDFFQVVHSRRSVRAFRAQPVEPEKLLAVLETASRAPSAGNLQAYGIYLVTQAVKLEALAHAAGDQEFIAQAPLALVFCAHPARAARKYGQRGQSLYCLQDATIAAAFALLAVTALGLASTWVGAFEEEVVRQVLRAPKSYLPVAILPIGYAAEQPDTTSRRPFSELVHEIR